MKIKMLIMQGCFKKTEKNKEVYKTFITRFHDSAEIAMRLTFERDERYCCSSKAI